MLAVTDRSGGHGRIAGYAATRRPATGFGPVAGGGFNSALVLSAV
jgi:hypothetical protein